MNELPTVAGYGKSGTIVGYEDVTRLVGKLLTYIDATYSDKEQREAQKTILKGIVYDWSRDNREWHGMTEIEFSYKDADKIPKLFTWWDKDGTIYSSEDIKVTRGTRSTQEPK